METIQPTGKVILAGAGPGDPELITAKAIRYLRQADVVLTDRLVSDTILRDYVHPQAEVIYVGKQCRRGNSTPQATINELMVQYARQGRLVVRLKGGDVSIFSNILDELQALTASGIPYEIIPGVTAALGAAATAGMPLTARGYATAVRFLTFYKSDVITETYWKELAATEDTLVFYMSSETLDQVVQQLVRCGADPARKLAVVEQATTPNQRVYVHDLYEYARRESGRAYLSPSLVVIGRVVDLHSQFAWMGVTGERTEYFKPGAFLAAGQPAAGEQAAKRVNRA
ncbi:MAG TPA: uroporphyrinogen-III C-methyltransferase [Chitinophagaceae bacterium]|nr:uroporphyrinogen-III C-methyltransferase [Chitinophagaceae bacterium]